jgi:hypothetical protein
VTQGQLYLLLIRNLLCCFQNGESFAVRPGVFTDDVF